MVLIRNTPSPELRSLVAQIGGTWSGDTAMCRCPAHADRTPSLSIRQGDRGILVTCHAGCDRRDVLRALARQVRLPVFDKADIERSAERHGTAHIAIWQAGRPIEGTLAERYVREVRGLSAELADIRFHPRCPKGSGKLASFEPALLVGMREGGRIAAIQRIFLDPQTARYTDKRVLGRAMGAAWTNGPPARTFGICEGFETAAAHTSLTGIQTWASMGARRLSQIDIPAGTERVIILADNDDEGRRAAALVKGALARPGLTIETRWPPGPFKDWAQILER